MLEKTDIHELKPGDFCLVQILESGKNGAVLEVIDRFDTSELLEEPEESPSEERASDRHPESTGDPNRRPSEEVLTKSPHQVLETLKEGRKVFDRAIADLQHTPSQIRGPDVKDISSPVQHRRFPPASKGQGHR